MRDTKGLFDSARAIRLGLSLSQRISRRTGHGLARLGANLLAWLRPQMYWNVHANLSQVLGPDTPAEVLHETVRRTFFHSGCNQYDYFHAVGGSRDELAKVLHVPASFWDTLAQAKEKGQGVMFVTGHLSNFDLAALSLVARGMEVQALSLRDPPEGFQLVNQLRLEAGISITPISNAAIRQAIRRLRQGGIVLTGVEYPTGPGLEPLEFFGRPAMLPTGHVRLAMMTNAVLLAAAVVYRRETGYALRVAPPVELARTGHKKQDVKVTAERVLAILADWIRETPDQWMMFLPVWPKLLQHQPEDAQSPGP